MTFCLRKTYWLLALAAAVVLLASVFVGRDFVNDVFPRCRGTIRIETELVSDVSGLERVPLDFDDHHGPRLRVRYDTYLDYRGAPKVRTRNIRIERLDCGVGLDDVTCGTVWLPDSVIPERVTVFRNPNSGLYFVDHDGRRSLVPIAAFRVVDAPTRHVQLRRLLAPRHIPSLVVLISLAGLVIVAVRSRAALAYARSWHAWIEASLRLDGRVESAAGMIGVLATTDRPISPGPVLVKPDVVHRSGGYRELPMLERHHIVAGSHKRWRTGTLIRLRDARTLAIVSLATTMTTLLVHLLHGG